MAFPRCGLEGPGSVALHPAVPLGADRNLQERTSRSAEPGEVRVRVVDVVGHLRAHARSDTPPEADVDANAIHEPGLLHVEPGTDVPPGSIAESVHVLRREPHGLASERERPVLLLQRVEHHADADVATSTRVVDRRVEVAQKGPFEDPDSRLVVTHLELRATPTEDGGGHAGHDLALGTRVETSAREHATVRRATDGLLIMDPFLVVTSRVDQADQCVVLSIIRLVLDLAPRVDLERPLADLGRPPFDEGDATVGGIDLGIERHDGQPVGQHDALHLADVLLEGVDLLAVLTPDPGDLGAERLDLALGRGELGLGLALGRTDPRRRGLGERQVGLRRSAARHLAGLLEAAAKLLELMPDVLVIGARVLCTRRVEGSREHRHHGDEHHLLEHARERHGASLGVRNDSRHQPRIGSIYGTGMVRC